VHSDVDEVKRQNDTVLLEVLAAVREELDEVAENFIDDFTGITNATELKWWWWWWWRRTRRTSSILLLI
jgi:hypothetical protein